MWRALPLLALCTGCVPKSEALVQPWRFEARTTHGVVRVLPVVVTTGRSDVDLDSYVGAGLPWMREWLRSRRTDEIDRIPHALGVALPGAVNGALGARWDGQFLQGSFAPTTRSALRSALRGKGDVDEALAATVRGLDGSAALITWVTELEGRPLTATGFPGDIVVTDSGPVVLDHIEEPYLIDAQVGMALVARDGEVVLRYTDRFSTVLSARRDSAAAAADLAAALAAEVQKVWACDPRLEDAAVSDSRDSRTVPRDSVELAQTGRGPGSEL
ncbi:MAG: hypothetical protein R3F61_36250 [Myxococcota bacterium]